MGPTSAPTGRLRGASKEDSSAQRVKHEALGRSRGGSGMKACVITGAIGRAVAFVLAPGQDHELPHAMPLLDTLSGVPKWVVADPGYSSCGPSWKGLGAKQADRVFLHGHPLPRRHMRLDQAPTSPNKSVSLPPTKGSCPSVST